MKMDYRSRKGEICFLGSISNILYNYKEEISEGALLRNSAGYNFRVFYTENIWEKDFWLECVNFNNPDYSELAEFLSEKGYKISEYAFSDKNMLYRFLLEKTSAGIPVMVSMDLYNLPYHGEYQKTHFEHIVVVYKCDNYCVGMSDCCPSKINVPYYEDCYKWTDFFTMLFESDASHVWCIEKNNKLNKNEQSARILKETKPFLTGVNAIRNLSEQYMQLDRTSHLSIDIKKAFRYHYLLFTGFGGPVVSRRLYAEYLTELGYIDLADECNRLMNQWNIISKNLMRAFVFESKDYVYIFASELMKIADSEQKFIKKLEIENLS